MTFSPFDPPSCKILDESTLDVQRILSKAGMYFIYPRVKNIYHKAFIFQMYGRLNHINICVSYCATLRVAQKTSTLNSAPLKQWIKEDIIFKFWGDNMDKMQKVRDLYDLTIKETCFIYSAYLLLKAEHLLLIFH